MALDLSQDWKVIDDPQTVTLAPKTGEGTYAAGVSVTYAQWEELSEQDYVRYPFVGEQRTRWVHVWAAKLQGKVTTRGDKVTDAASTDWTVKEVQHLDLDANGVQRYRLLVQVM